MNRLRRRALRDGVRRISPTRGHLPPWACASARALVVALGAGAAAACGPRQPEPPAGELAAAAVPPPAFTDVTEAAGIRFVHDNGASEHRYLPETMGSGVAFFDYDGDGRPDLYFVNSRPVDPESGTDSGADAPTGALYRNRGDGTFEDVTRRAGLDQPLFGMGAAAGDVDNDGWTDLFVSGVGGDRLYCNRGDGTFEEVGAAWGLTDRGFGSSAAFVDFDRDGRLDLFAGRYVEWSPETDVRCSPDGDHRIYCTPEVYPPVASRLYRNLGRRFEDVTEAAGLTAHPGKALGVVPLDHDGDGWPDLALANDTAADFLFRNRRDGTFEEIGLETGMAVSESGAPRGGMGIDAGDLDGDGREDLVIGNFSQEMAGLYRASERGVYADVAAQAGVGLPTLLTLAFGTLAFDHDGDGALDVAFANGHIEPEIARFYRLQSYAQPLQLFHNRDRGERFEEATRPEAAGPAWWGPWVARGLAAADYDGDGDLDLVVTQNGGAARLLRNDSPPGRWLRVALSGTASNRSGYGAVVTAVAGERRIARRLTSGRSYLSASEPVVTIGLGDVERVERLEVLWPSGLEQVVEEPPLGRLLDLEEPHGDGRR